MTKEVLQNCMFKDLEENDLSSIPWRQYSPVNSTVISQRTWCLFYTRLSLSMTLHMADMTSYMPNAKVATG